LFIGGGFAIAVLILVYIILPLYESAELGRQALRQDTRRLQQAILAIQNREQYAGQLTQVNRQLSQLQGQLLDADSEAMAQNQLESTVREIAESSGITISRSTPLQARKLGEQYSRVTVQINLQGGMAELTSFLQALSVHPKFLKVEDFYINGFRVRDQIRLQPRIQVSGLIRLSES
jgi:Tfp pilus assembly protein PilO